MIGGFGLWELMLIVIIVLVVGLPIYLTYKLSKLKGRSGTWAFLNIVSFPVAFLVTGLLKPAPGFESAKAKSYSTWAIIVGAAFLILPIVASILTN